MRGYPLGGRRGELEGEGGHQPPDTAGGGGGLPPAAAGRGKPMGAELHRSPPLICWPGWGSDPPDSCTDREVRVG